MNVDWLRYFVELSETNNFHVAAEKLSITPPTLSKAISELESHYELKLINREHRMQGLTPAGELFLEKAKNILFKMDNLKNYMDALKTGDAEGPITIAGGGMTMKFFVPPVIKALLNKYPKISPKLFSMTSVKIEKNILDGKIDIGIMVYPPSSSEIDFTVIDEFSFVIVGKPNTFGNNWKELPFIVFKFFGENEISQIDSWPEKKYKRKVIMTVESLYTLISFCENGLGVAYIPEIVARESIKKGLLAIVSTPPFETSGKVYLVWSKNFSNNPTVTFKETMKAFLKKETTGGLLL